MQISCPECGENVTSEQINIQQLIAVCPSCNNVFHFDLPTNKLKRRKVSQPRHLSLQETDRLHFAYRTNFRLDQNEAFISSAVGSVLMTFVAFLLTGEYFAGDVPFLLPVIFGFLSLFLYYWMATIVFNKTHINMDDLSIAIDRRPLPSLFGKDRKVNLSGVQSIYSEETPSSVKEAYDTPRYHVWAGMADGSRKIIVTDVTEDYAVFIAQRLNARLHGDIPADISRLTDEHQRTTDTDLGDRLHSAGLSDERHEDSRL